MFQLAFIGHIRETRSDNLKKAKAEGIFKLGGGNSPQEIVVCEERSALGIGPHKARLSSQAVPRLGHRL